MNSKPTIYVVDDEPAILSSLRALFKMLNWHVKTYLSAEAFLDDYEVASPCCLILDVRMPGMDGLALQEHLEERGIELPIIFITGHSDVAVAVDSMKAGAVDFLEKPFDTEALLSRIRQVLDRQDGAGILTRVTRQLSPLEARELFCGIATRLVLGILTQMDQSANVQAVRSISDHLCRPDVQDRLRACEHVRDGIADEICRLFKDSSLKEVLSRDALFGIIQTSGAVNDLVAMEACLLRIEAA